MLLRDQQVYVHICDPTYLNANSARSVYANSFLATLNTRRVSRGRGTDAETATMPTFLMVGKITRNQPNEYADHAYPPDVDSKTHYYSTNSQGTMEIGVEQEVTITRDSVSVIERI
jgi:hypothetical protein